MKPYKYYAIRVNRSIVFRKTVIGLKKVQSKLTKKNGTILVQTTFTGGIVIGSIPYQEFLVKTGRQIADGGCKLIERDTVHALYPFIIGVNHG